MKLIKTPIGWKDFMMQMKKNKIYLLIHSYYYGDNDQHEEIKELGLFETKTKAKEAIKRYKLLPGFDEYVLECFVILEFELDK